MALQSEYYNVFKVKYHLALQDTEETETRYHLSRSGRTAAAMFIK